MLQLVDDEGPRGVLLAFLADGSTGCEGNMSLLSLLAAERDAINRMCWGVILMQPDEHFGAGEELSPLTPTHADLLVRECEIDPACSARELPALVLRTADLKFETLLVKGAGSLSDAATRTKLRFHLAALEDERAGKSRCLCYYYYYSSRSVLPV